MTPINPSAALQGSGSPSEAGNSRGEFEAFHASRKNKGVHYRENLFNRREDGTYAEDSVQRHWWTWQQARASLDTSASRIEKLRQALEDIAAMTYDSWTNGAKAGEIAVAALRSLPPEVES